MEKLTPILRGRYYEIFGEIRGRCGKVGEVWYNGGKRRIWRSAVFDVWKNVLAEIERKIPSTHFSTWFTDTSFVGIKGDTAIVGVPNVFKEKQLRSKYNDLISTALRNNGVNFKRLDYSLQSKSRVRKTGREITPDAETAARTGRVERIKVPVKKVEGFKTGLNAKYTMSGFVIGSNNDLAVSVAKNVIDQPGERFNPFFLYGGPGLGKTHLVQAIGNELLSKNPKMKVLYTPINHFYSEFIESIQKKEMDKFQKKYKSLDVLIIDDFQFIVGKEKSQEEFFNIFNDMYQQNKQIIVTSDRLPGQIKTVDERLASRLMQAGPIDMQFPSFEDRCAILRSKAEYMGVEIEAEAIEFLAENVKTNIRELEGEFQRVLALAELKGVTPLGLINDGYVKTANVTHARTATPRRVVEKVAKHYDLTVKEMCGKSRVAHIKNARQVTMYLLSEELQMSTPKIAREVGVKDHTTVMHGIKKIKGDLKLNFSLRDQLAEIREEIYE